MKQLSKSLFVSLLLLLASDFVAAQSLSKAFKALDAQDWQAARTAFEAALEVDKTDPAAHFGMSRLYGSKASGMRDKEMALKHLVQAEFGLGRLDDKSKSKLSKMGVSNAELVTRRDQIEKSFLQDAKNAGTVDAYNHFIERFPESPSARIATNYRNAKAFEEAKTAGTVDALDAFIASYPEAEEIEDVIVERDKKAAEEALKAGTVAAFSHFLAHYPEAPQAPQMQQRLNAAAFEEAKKTNTVNAYKAYIEKYPSSIFIMQAKDKLEWLESGGGN